MTQLETNSELAEIFDYKWSLTEKIDHNMKELEKLQKMLGDEECAHDWPEIKRAIMSGKKIVSVQKTERNKLSTRRIAKQLGINPSTVTYRYNNFCGVIL